jgi:hypothetical protein
LLQIRDRRLQPKIVEALRWCFGYNEPAGMKETKQNIRYLGFQSTEDGGRRFEFAITATGEQATPVSLDIPPVMFTGSNRITFQESAKICYEKLRVLLENQKIQTPLRIRLTGEDIAQLRHVPRGRQRIPKA